MRRPWRRAAVAAVAGAAAIAAQFTVIAPAQAAGPAITIAATSKLPAVTGSHFVIYRGGTYSRATIHGAVTGGAAGEVAALYGQQFPYTKPAARLGAITLKTSAKTAYSFTVTPTLATHYAVRLFASPTATTPMATSPVQNVYVANLQSFTAAQKCARPVCHETLHVYTWVPSAALKFEMGKHVYPYFGINLGGVSIPPPPKWLYLNAGHAHVAALRKISADEYEVTVSFSFTIGSDSYFWLWAECQRDAVSKDGLGLPGYHGCGGNRISVNTFYIG
jgi:hypothetical protein